MRHLLFLRNTGEDVSIPSFQAFLRPLLILASDQVEHSGKKTASIIAAQMSFSEDDLMIMIPSGTVSVFKNRLGWARTYLKKAGLIEYPRRGWFSITKRGMDALADKQQEINMDYLRQFPEFIGFKSISTNQDMSAVHVDELQIEAVTTPEELLEKGYQNIRDELSSQILQAIAESTPLFFERLVVKLLVAMGYGGTVRDAGKAIGKSGDGGIDGIIKEDKLGLERIYIQAKRWENTVGRPEIQKFVGALQGFGAKKGVFITTSTFSKEAFSYASTPDINVVLVDGKQLSELMIDHDVGVINVSSYHVKRIDVQYYSEE